MHRLWIICLALVFLTNVAAAQESEFRQPVAAITQLLTAPPPPLPLAHAQSGHLALLQEEAVISMARLLTPRLGLAGFRFEPVTRISGIEPMVMQVQVLDVRTEPTPAIKTWQPPSGARLTRIQFSPDGLHLSALQVASGQATRLVVFDVATGSAHVLSDQINPAWDNPCLWADNQHLLCRLQTDVKSVPDPAPGPVVVAHSGEPLQTRTYSNLLETAADDARFEYYFSSDLGLIDLAGKHRKLTVTRGIMRGLSLSPDGRFLLLRRIAGPYPRFVTAGQFPNQVEVWDLAKGERLYQSPLSGFGIDTSLLDQADPDSIQWAPGTPVTAGYLFQQDQGNGVINYQWRTLRFEVAGAASKLKALEPQVLVQSSRPIRQFGWTSAGTPWFIARTDDADTVAIHTIQADGPRQLGLLNKKDRAQQAARVIRVNGDSGPVLELNHAIFVASPGLDEGGARPWLDRVDLASGQSKRLFTAEQGVLESVLAVLDADKEILLTERETETTPPAFMRIAPGKITTLYQSANPYPQLNGVTRRQIDYPRKDGVQLHGTLYLPPGKHKRPLPTLVWIYPREYDDPQQAEQMDTRPLQFHSIKGPAPIAAVLAGYAVLVNPTMPIISSMEGDSEAYLPQLVSSAEAAVDYLVKSGISDAKRMAIGGRSYGAFSSVNLLIHSDRFASAIAMSGAYNRTLTPFGFQHEKRTFWQEQEYYASISPFFSVDRINQPLLLVHGGEDPNPGTPKIQARRLFHALMGEGATVRYVELPGEEHHYRGRDTVLHATWEMIDWLDHTIGAQAR